MKAPVVIVAVLVIIPEPEYKLTSGEGGLRTGQHLILSCDRKNVIYIPEYTLIMPDYKHIIFLFIPAVTYNCNIGIMLQCVVIYYAIM